jgi:hypothetical protein
MIFFAISQEAQVALALDFISVINSRLVFDVELTMPRFILCIRYAGYVPILLHFQAALTNTSTDVSDTRCVVVEIEKNVASLYQVSLSLSLLTYYYYC